MLAEPEDMWGNSCASNTGVSDIPEGEERMGQKNIWRNNGWHFPKFLVKDKVLPDSSGEDTFSPLGCVCVCVCVGVHTRTHSQARLSLCDLPGLQLARVLCPRHFSGKNTGVGSHFLYTPGDLSSPGVQPPSRALAGGFFTTEPPGKPSPPDYCFLFQLNKYSIGSTIWQKLF